MMNRFARATAAVASAALLWSLTPVAAFAVSPAVVEGTASPMICSDRGHHVGTSNVSDVYMVGSYPRNYVDPGVTYSITVGTTTTITGTLSTAVSASFFSVVSAQIGVSIARAQTVAVTSTFTWKNETSATQWVQLGGHGRSFNYSEYDVVSPCRITNVRSGHATLPTDEAWFKHS